MIGGVILAAGESFRMGSPKALLDIGGRTFLEHCVDVLQSAGVTRVVAVLGADEQEIRRRVRLTSATMVTNSDWQSGQLSSLVAGLNALACDGLEGAVVWPVDRPLVGPDVVKSLCDAFRSSGKGVVVPVYRGRRGHPVVFSVKLFDELKLADPAIGARQIVHAHPDEVAEVLTEVEGVVTNIDTPEDYRRILPRRH